MLKLFFHRMMDVCGGLLLAALKISGLGAPSKRFRFQDIRRILVIRTDRIGDLILSTPAFSALRDHFPNAHIACLVDLYTSDLVEGNPCLSEIITYSRKKIRNPVRMVNFVARLRREKFDMAVVLNYAPDAILMAYLSGAPVRVGSRIPGFGAATP